jgi:heat shock transcription factor
MQQRPLATRKRAAPGASPTPQQPQPQQQFNNGVPFQPLQEPFGPFDNQALDWNASNNVGAQFTDPSAFDSNLYDAGMNGSLGLEGGLGPIASPQSGQLVRRNPNQQLVSRGQPSWQDPGGGSTQPGDAQWPPLDDEADLEQRALAAKKEAQAKRKQIPPFVQKLSR